MGIRKFLRSLSPEKSAAAPAEVAEPQHAGIPGCPCTVCGSEAALLDTVDFNKSCENKRGYYLAPSGRKIDYFLCDGCGFCFAPEIQSWSIDQFSEHIYNEEYGDVDPDYEFERPTNNAREVHKAFGNHKSRIRHLDYGGGSGLLSENLRQLGWDSCTYDPFVDREMVVEQLGQFDLITVFEVFEHVPDVNDLCDKLQKLCKPSSLILLSTMFSDEEIGRGRALDWWYAAPRNGHISLFSRKSLTLLMSRRGLKLVSFTPWSHAAFGVLPDWAANIDGSAAGSVA
jgi:hypothetical protein